jgi:bifunctional UDP-N-acetylglucosamine pyrophosphorylase/glucosamine-1-phosphate N-acetyltransferase
MLASIILAAGKGTRMKSKYPKVLHKVAGKPLIWHVCKAIEQLGIDENIIVVGYKASEVKKNLGDKYKYAFQEKQLGTGHAVMQAEKLIDKDVNCVLVVCGDTPLIRGETLEKLLQHHQNTKAAATILSTELADPTNYGRIVRSSGGMVIKIVEEKDANEIEKGIKEINSGTYCFDRKLLFDSLKEITPQNQQDEYYLTDVIDILVRKSKRVEAFVIKESSEIIGINNRIQLAEVENIFKKRINEKHMLDGVTIIDPDNTYIESSVKIGQDTVVYPFTFLKGNTIIGENCTIYQNSTLENTVIGDNTEINHTIAKDSKIGSNCIIGPFSYLRPGTELADNVKVGDFVEIKKSSVGINSKIPHLSYIGDCVIGKNVNVGAGTITCNYDGKNKWQTIMEDGSFIGSNTNLVAPVKVGKDAMIGAGSTITEDVPSRSLAIARGKQRNIENWVDKNQQK